MLGWPRFWTHQLMWMDLKGNRVKGGGKVISFQHRFMTRDDGENIPDFDSMFINFHRRVHYESMVKTYYKPLLTTPVVKILLQNYFLH